MVDEDELRESAWLVLDHLPADTTAALLSRYGTADVLVHEMLDRGRQVGRRLAHAGRVLPVEDHSLFAVALLSVKRGCEGVQEKPLRVVETFDRLKSFGDIPLDVAVRTRLLRETDLVPLLAATSRLARCTRSDLVSELITTMVAAAVVTRRGPDSAPDVVALVLAQGAELAGRRPHHGHQSGVDDRYTVMGNSDLTFLIAGCRAALDELDGTPATDALVASHTAEIARTFQEASTARRRGEEADSLRGLGALARFLGGGTAEKIVVHLQSDLFAAKAPRPRGNEIPVDHDNSAFDRIDGDDASTLTLAVDEIAERVLVDLCWGTKPAERDALARWLSGAHPPDSQDHLLLCLGQLRQVDRGLRLERPAVPAPHHPVLVRVVRSRVADALRLGLTGGTLLQAVLPPLWTNRNAAVLFVASKLRAGFRRRGHTWTAKAHLAASVVVRSPAQQVHRAADQDRPGICCETPHGRNAPEPARVCPHRPWSEGGRVEDYTTLTAIADYPSEDATRMHLRRYRGPWECWVKDAMEP
ncbi:hypothetical protein [Lentzea sp. CA-135723]|uniref:hypothetical protein n=1 Tax=Lentzea sp. CA-135723 TaxID=3239950 RepID=UPI003D8B2031